MERFFVFFGYAHHTLSKSRKKKERNDQMMNRMAGLFTIVLLGALPMQSIAQGPPEEIVTPSGKVITPPTSIENPGDHGQRGHTNHLIVVPQKGLSRSSAPVGETPGSLACVYGLTSSITGCPITGKISSGNNNLAPATGGGGIIAIVDAYDYPTAEHDLNVFSDQFGLPSCTTANGCFQKVYASSSKPAANCGWAQEAALDIQWAHAMAPKAQIVLVEAASNSFADLLFAVDKATAIVQASGQNGQVSMSWGGSEFSSEASNDYHFTSNNGGVVYFGASGDSGGKTIWPGVSSNVVSAGGTTINRNSSGNYLSETAWSGSGGGKSTYESIPSYQNAISDVVGTKRGVPDISFDANPNTGVWVYDSTSCQGLSGWMIFGGTSVSSPALAGISNLAGSFYSTSAEKLGTLYRGCGNGASTCSSSEFRDITSGTAGSFTAKQGWDFVTGLGSNMGLAGK
ncbi:MAG: S53 family peptidase [Candidatus Binatia bacterium]